MPPPLEYMEIGYFHGCNTFWNNNRLDVNVAWKLVSEGAGKKVTFCCTGVDRSCVKKYVLNEESHVSESTKKPKCQNQKKEEP